MTADDPEASGRPDHARLLTLAAHELRTPVSVVSGYLRMLVREGSAPLPAGQRTLVEQAIRSCTDLAALVDELSELGRREAQEALPALARHDLGALVQAAALDAQAELGDGPDLIVHVPDPRGFVMADAARLRRALAVTIRAVARERVAARSVVVRATVDPAGGRAAIVVGTAEEVDRGIGGRREPADVWRGGLGLGLPIARRVVEQHGGEILAVSSEDARPGRGAVVVTIPVAVPPA